MSISIPKIGLYIVGDEILSGRRQDQHLSKVISLLGDRGLKLSWAQIIGDGPEQQIRAYQQSFASGDIVFSCGGIGSTPDDHTRQAAAAALGLPLVLHPEARECIRQRCEEMAAQGKWSADMNDPQNQLRLRMGEFPLGSEIVPNHFNNIPGFRINNHTFVPGFPVMAWPMIEWVLDTYHRDIQHYQQWLEKSVIVYELFESQVTPLMESIEAQFPSVSAFSLPTVSINGSRPFIELGVKGEPRATEQAWAHMLTALKDLGGTLGEWR